MQVQGVRVDRRRCDAGGRGQVSRRPRARLIGMRTSAQLLLLLQTTTVCGHDDDDDGRRLLIKATWAWWWELGEGLGRERARGTAAVAGSDRLFFAPSSAKPTKSENGGESGH